MNPTLPIFISVVLIIVILLHVHEAKAVPSFGTLMPKSGEWQAGMRADLIFDRDIKDYDGAKSSAYYYKASYGFADWFCFDGLIGLGRVKAEYINEKELRYPYNFSGGYGVRAKLYQNKEYGLEWAFGFQHISTHPNDQLYRSRKHQIIWDEWQLSTLLSKRLWALMPYCGIKYSFTYLISKVDDDRHRRLSNGSPIGLVVGTDAKLNNYLYLNVEGRFFDELGLNAGFTVRY